MERRLDELDRHEGRGLLFSYQNSIQSLALLHATAKNYQLVLINEEDKQAPVQLAPPKAVVEYLSPQVNFLFHNTSVNPSKTSGRATPRFIEVPYTTNNHEPQYDFRNLIHEFTDDPDFSVLVDQHDSLETFVNNLTPN